MRNILALQELTVLLRRQDFHRCIQAQLGSNVSHCMVSAKLRSIDVMESREDVEEVPKRR